MRIAIIGADGQLGTDLLKVIPGKDALPLTIKELDITDPGAVRALLSREKPEAVINTAAYTDVDACEAHDLDAYRVNGHGARNLALVCAELGAVLAHISTDYVFSGDKGSPYNEGDVPDPRSAYGVSKLAGEQFVKYISPKHYIVRSSGLFGVAGCLGKGGGNFVESILKRARAGEKLRVVTDEIVGPTYTRDLADKILELIKTGKFGTYHITNGGACSWWEFAEAIVETTGLNVPVEKTTAAEFKAKAHRPKYSVLDNSNLRKIGLAPLRPWREALKAYLNK